jgi:hypothetical protein
MNGETEPGSVPSKMALPLVALGLLLAAWVVYWVGQYRATQLDLSRFGRCEEVYEALARDGYVARFQVPYFAAAVLLDGLVFVSLLSAVVFGRFRLLGVLVAVLWLPTLAWHALACFVTSLFAA